tara:strand:+ start:4706 stop:5251 length:546 start_codon:yes stop_codon:yes gene_type:complete
VAIAHYSFGKNGGVKVRFGQGDGDPQADLGYSRNGVDITIEQKWEDVESDDYGGTGGVPADRQFLGAVAKITTELTKYERSEVEKLLSYSHTTGSPTTTTLGGVMGVLPDIGSFVRQDGLYGKLDLIAASGSGSLTRTFAQCFVSEALEVNLATKNSVYMVKWEAWIDSVEGMILFTEATQ